MRSDHKRAWIETVHSRGTDVEVLFPGRLVVMNQKDTALPVDAPVRSHDQVVCGMMRVGRPQSLQNGITHIRLVVAVGILEEQQVRA